MKNIILWPSFVNGISCLGFYIGNATNLIRATFVRKMIVSL